MRGFAIIRVWIWIGAGLFLIALAGSALIIPELRLLHLLQAFIYVAIIVLARRNSPWGYGAGFAIALFWNAFSLFVTHLMQAGVGEFWSLIRTGQVKRPDTMMVLVGGIGHFILIAACLAAIFHRSTDKRRWWKFTGGGILALAYFVLIVAVARPR
jgi:drug/metabolite transporter (DMT)-like permease